MKPSCEAMQIVANDGDALIRIVSWMTLWSVDGTRPTAATIQDVTDYVEGMLNCLYEIQNAIFRNASTDDGEFAFAAFPGFVQVLKTLLPEWQEKFRGAHNNQIQEFQGRSCRSFHELAFDLCREKQRFLWDFVTRNEMKSKRDDSFKAACDRAAEILVTKRELLRRYWEGPEVDCIELVRRVRQESELAIESNHKKKSANEVVDQLQLFKAKARSLAQTDLKGGRRRIVEIVCDSDDPVSLATLAVDVQIGWDKPYEGKWSSAMRGINKVMKPIGIRLRRHDSAVSIVILPAPKRETGRKTKRSKSAPKRR